MDAIKMSNPIIYDHYNINNSNNNNNNNNKNSNNNNNCNNDNNKRIKQNMYEKLTLILKYIFHCCEEQENNFHCTSSVVINLIENQTEGNIQIDVDGPWSKEFNIGNFYVEISDHFHEKLNLTINHGNQEKNIYYLYTIDYNEKTQRTETILTIDPKPIIDQEYYLRITIKTTVNVIKHLFHKLKTFLQLNASSYPSVKIQFNARSITENDSDVVDIRMITDAMDEILKYSIDNEFRSNVYNIFGVDDKKSMMNELYDSLCKSIPDVQ